MKDKFFRDFHDAAEKLFDDIGANQFKIYDVPEYGRIAKISVHPDSIKQKFTHVIVAASGEASTDSDWMIVAPYRLDVTSATHEKCYDLDPVLFVLDSSSGTPHPSGVVSYHQSFDGRTTPVEGYEAYDFEDAVEDLRSQVIADQMPLEDAPEEVLNALQHMVRRFRSDFLDSDR